ncbi:MAG TPA: YlxR family protein [Acholeplasmataceae bacterium]|jgi:predicted RNA-binding protein YlxR (DUF448 family)|nr:YlxR family protein [Acholeplasmataceae bacterium]
MKQRKIPMRKCIATNEQYPKSEMFRVVRSEDNTVLIDGTGKARGRGAYISKTKRAINLAKKKNLLERHLEVKVPEEIYDQLLNLLGDVIE